MSRVTQIYFTVDDTTTATNKTLEYYVVIINYINTQYHGYIKQSKVLIADLFNMFSNSHFPNSLRGYASRTKN